jgi:tetratricopeptide (TPR) repeat protein
MSQIEIIKSKVSKLVNQYNVGNYKEVINGVNILLKKLPNNSYLLNLLGSSYQKMGHYETAKKNFLQVLVTEPKNLAAMNNLANTLRDTLDFEKAEELFQKILQIDSNYLNGITNFANLKLQLDQYEEAITLYNQALKLDNKSYSIHYNIGLTYQSYGNFEKAEYHFKEMLKLNPKATGADRLISRFTKYDKDNNHFKDMIKRSEFVEDLNDRSKINLYFALGKAFEDTKDFEKSFTFLKKANDLANSEYLYDKKAEHELNDTLKKIFDEIKIDNSIKRDRDKKIIFILGLPRSGTSLTEQIISSHTDVYGMGESSFLEKLIYRELYTNGKLNKDIITKNQFYTIIDDLGQKYINLLKNYKFSENIVTEKDPLNFKWIGFINLIFPNSKIIHCYRNLEDNFLSIYKNFFPEGLSWSNNEENLVDYIRNYKSLMDYWKKKFPNTIYDLSYEKLISDQNIEIKKLIKFCNLEWQEQCLNFHKTKRSIKTLSVAEARKPIYKSSLSGSSNFKPFFKKSFDILKEL